MAAPRGWRTGAAALLVLASCSHDRKSPTLEKPTDEDVPAIPDVPVPPETGPKLGATANVAPILDRPSKRGETLGYLHAGETLARAAEPFSMRGCGGGWFPVRPRGFVCAGPTATLDLGHPTLVAMGMHADRGAPLPHAYARVVRDTTLYEADGAREGAARALGELRAKSGLAVVGSWTALDPGGAERRFAMTTEGRFVAAEDLESATPSQFHGVALEGDVKLPVAFVVKRGVHAWKLREDEPEKQGILDYHAQVDLTGRMRTVSSVELWATKDGRWVRLSDVTLIRERHEFPELATAEQRWLDVSVVTGTLVAYEGRKAVFATLASVGRDRLGAPGSTQTTTRGEHRVTGKELTLAGRDPASFADGIALYDVPWALTLSSGQLLVGAYWHDRFGIEHGPGNIEVSPADAARLFAWASPSLPEGWHGVRAGARDEAATMVNVRK